MLDRARYGLYPPGSTFKVVTATALMMLEEAGKLSVDDPVEKLKPYAAQYKINYPVLVGLGRDDVQEAYGPLWGIPASFIISKDGKVCRKHMGIAPEAVFEKEVAALLN